MQTFKLRPIGKKADLSLSINAIVILILAITMLGLGLGFLRGTFKKTTSQFSEVADTVKTQIVDKIKASNEKVAFDKLEITLKRGATKDQFYGIRNVLTTDQPSTVFDIVASCDKSLKAADAAEISSYIKFATFSQWEVEQGEIEVLKLQVIAQPEAKLDTYSCKLEVKAENKIYATKKFFVVVN